MVLAQLSCTIFYKEKTGLVLQCRVQEELERMLWERTSSGSCIFETEFKNRITLEKLRRLGHSGIPEPLSLFYIWGQEL